MKSISCREIAREILDRCVAGKPPKSLPQALIEEPCASALFGVLVEGLADRFEPALCDAYVRLFAQAIAHVTGSDAATLVSRYEWVRRPRKIAADPKRVFVLSRVTLGADVAVTSVLLAAAKQRFPHAEIALVGPLKNYELFVKDERIHHLNVDYARGGLRQRFAAADELRALAAQPECIVLDPDSRLTQLGLLPICPEDRYYFFESRAYAAQSDRSLPELTAEWAAETLGVTGAKPYIAVEPATQSGPYIAISLGVGENPAKRIPDPFEQQLISVLAKTGLPIWIDKGAGGAEAERVLRAVNQSGAAAGPQIQLWDGSFAGFASLIAGSKFYVGYDSAGQHIAAACGVPLIAIFAGFPAPRMFDRWRPVGSNCHVIRVEQPDPLEVLGRVQEALQQVT